MPANVVKSVADRARAFPLLKLKSSGNAPKQKYALARHIFKKIAKSKWDVSLGEHEVLTMVIDSLLAEKK